MAVWRALRCPLDILITIWKQFVVSLIYILSTMETYNQELEQLRSRIPRRHSVENVLEMNNIADEYEDILRKIEAINDSYAKNTAPLFDQLDEVRSKIKLSSSSKNSKKNKDMLFDEASGLLKDGVQALMEIL